MINQASFTRTKAQATSTSVSPEELLDRLNASLDQAEPTGQYNAIKELVGNREVAVLKKHFSLDGYVTAHRMRWDLINAYNDE